jgi:Catalytic LigB subunit of aromatic ring-opening dioxygenase
MASVVGALGLPHNPHFPELVMRLGAGCGTASSFAFAAAQFRALRPDVALIFTTDHLNTFFFDNLPLLAIGAADDFGGPNDEVPMVTYRRRASNPSFARHLHASMVSSGFDVALTQEFEVDHSIVVPLEFIDAVFKVPAIPIFVSTHIPPRPTSRRCFALGKAVLGAVRSWPDPLRVVAIGSGSFSFDVHGHLSPPGKLVGVPDPDWVLRVAEHLKRNTISSLIDEAEPRRFSRAGNVSGEVLNWIAMLGTIDGHLLSWIEPDLEFGNCYAVWR